jgi:hypothetical protein
MQDLDEIAELQKDIRILRENLRDSVSTPKAEEIYKEIKIINKRLMKLRNRN